MKALILSPYSERSLLRLRERIEVTYEPWTETRRLQDPEKLAARLREEGTSVIVVEADFLFEPAFSAPDLKLAAVSRNALNHVDVEAATKHGVPIIHTPGRNAVAVAELTLGLMLSLLRHLPRAHTYTHGGGWTDPFYAYTHFRGRELSGSTVGVVGLGRIGKEVARRAQCFGAKVIGYDPYVSKRRAAGQDVPLVELPELLRRADIVTLHTSRETDGLIDGAALGSMKPDAYLINTGGERAVDIDALVSCLRDGRIAGAALDVYPTRMLSSGPLLDLDNVILTPHIGGATAETIERQSRMITEDIERLLRGERPRRVANPDALAVGTHGR